MAKTILIVDDDVAFQKTMAAKLEALTYKVVSAMDGEEGFNKAVSEKPDLILLDMKMPKLDGIGFLKKIKARGEKPEIPTLITSNLSTTDKISEGIAFGVKGYIVKSDETLETIVKEVEDILNAPNK